MLRIIMSTATHPASYWSGWWHGSSVSQQPERQTMNMANLQFENLMPNNICTEGSICQAGGATALLMSQQYLNSAGGWRTVAE